MSIELLDLNRRLDRIGQRITTLEVREGRLSLTLAGAAPRAGTAARNGTATVDWVKTRMTGLEHCVARLEADRHG